MNARAHMLLAVTIGRLIQPAAV